jgi:hypothetical protein
MHSVVTKALDPHKRAKNAREEDDAGRAVRTEDVCGYNPVG